MKRKIAVIFLLLLAASGSLFAQNNARMLTTVNTQTGTSYVFIPADTTRVTTFSNASPVAVSLPNGATFGFGMGTMITAISLGTGTVTITCTSCTINGSPTLVLGTGQGADIYGGSGVNYVALTFTGGSNIPNIFGEALGSPTLPWYLYASGISFVGTPFAFYGGNGSTCPPPSSPYITGWCFTGPDNVPQQWNGTAWSDQVSVSGITNNPPGTSAFFGFQSLGNSAVPLTMLNAGGGPFTWTSQFVGANIIPSTSTQLEADGLTGIVQNNSTTTNGVGLRPECLAGAANVKCWAINPVLADYDQNGNVQTGTTLQNEIDMNLKSTTTAGQGLAFTGSANVSNHNIAAIQVQPGLGTFSPYYVGFQFNDGSVGSGAAITFGTQATGNNQSSQIWQATGRDSGGTTHTCQWFVTAIGNWFNGACPVYSPAFVSTTTNPAAGGFLRLANADKDCTRNAANSADDCHGEIQKARVAGCATAASLNATCDTTITWASAFADASYTVTCNGDAVTSGVPIVQGIDISAAKSASAITVRTISITAAAAQFTVLDCTAVHD